MSMITSLRRPAPGIEILLARAALGLVMIALAGCVSMQLPTQGPTPGETTDAQVLSEGGYHQAAADAYLRLAKPRAMPTGNAT